MSVEEPAAFNEEGQPLVAFPRLLLGKRMTREITLRNNGIVPASCRVEMANHAAFTLSGGGQTTTLEPKRSQTLQLTFIPGEAAEYSHAIRLAVKHNMFEVEGGDIRLTSA